MCDMYGCVDESVEGKVDLVCDARQVLGPFGRFADGVDGSGLGRSADVDDVDVDVVVINLTIP
jgi:hypothetical protein